MFCSSTIHDKTDLNTVVDPGQHVVSGEVLRGPACGVNIDRHLKPSSGDNWSNKVWGWLKVCQTPQQRKLLSKLGCTPKSLLQVVRQGSEDSSGIPWVKLA